MAQTQLSLLQHYYKDFLLPCAIQDIECGDLFININVLVVLGVTRSSVIVLKTVLSPRPCFQWNSWTQNLTLFLFSTWN